MTVVLTRSHARELDLDVGSQVWLSRQPRRHHDAVVTAPSTRGVRSTRGQVLVEPAQVGPGTKPS